MAAKLEYYEGKDGWRWRLKAANGEVVAASTEGFENKRDALRGFEDMLSAVREVTTTSAEEGL